MKFSWNRVNHNLKKKKMSELKMILIICWLQTCIYLYLVETESWRNQKSVISIKKNLLR